MKWYVLFIYTFLVFSSFAQDTARSWVIVLDPGHGGKDPGALGTVLKEKEVVLSIALKLKKYLQTMPNTTVLLTREKDIFVPLAERASYANKHHANLFVSLHCNASKNKQAKGVEVYVMGMSKMDENLEVAIKENSVVTLEDNYETTYGGIDPNSTEAYIIFSHLQNLYLKKSLQLASRINKSLVDQLHFKDRGVHQAPFFVLWKTTMPSVLVEMGYISNKEDEKLLKSDSFQNEIALAIYKALVDYRKEIEKEEIASTRTNQAKNTKSSVLYKVQFASSTKPFDTNSKEFKSLAPISYEKQGKYYVYFSGEFTSKEEAIKHKNFVVSKGYKDAIVVSRKK